MADNVTLNSGSGGATLATDDVVGVHFQKVKIDVGGDGASAPLSDANPLPISDAGGSITVDGTVAVSGTVTVGSHAVTNAGTFAVQVDGAALTALQLIDNIVSADGAVFTRDTTSVAVAGAVVESSAPTLTNGDAAGLSMTTGGALRVAVASGGISGVTEDAASAGGEEGVLILGVRRDTAASSSGTDGDFSTLNLDASGRLHVNVGNTVTVGSHAVTNAGTFAVQESGTHIQVDDAAFTAATSKVSMAGFTADEGSTDSVDEGDGGAARMTLDRKQIITPYVHAAAGGQTPYYNLDCDESEDAIKASAGKLYWIHVMNLAATKRYLKLYNATTANVTVGTTTPVLSFPIPTMGDTNGAGFTIHFGDAGVQFDTAITVAATTGFADNDTGAPGANEVILNAGYA